MAYTKRNGFGTKRNRSYFSVQPNHMHFSQKHKTQNAN